MCQTLKIPQIRFCQLIALSSFSVNEDRTVYSERFGSKQTDNFITNHENHGEWRIKTFKNKGKIEQNGKA